MALKTRQMLDEELKWGHAVSCANLDGDLNGDSRQDIVAVGRQTKNVRIYWNETAM